MKKFLALFSALGATVLFSSYSHAQDKVPLSIQQQKDAEDLVAQIKAKLPVGWSVEYPVKVREFGTGFEPKKATDEVEISPPDFYRIKINRSGKLKMLRHNLINIGRGTDIYVEDEFGLTLEIVKFISKDEYAKTAAANENIGKQLAEKRKLLDSMHMNRKFDSYFPKTPEQKAQVAAYQKLKGELVSLPLFYYEGISLNYLRFGGWDNGDREFYRVQDKTIRLECARVTQEIDSIWTRYSGEKMKINEKELMED